MLAGQIGVGVPKQEPDQHRCKIIIPLPILILIANDSQCLILCQNLRMFLPWHPLFQMFPPPPSSPILQGVPAAELLAVTSSIPSMTPCQIRYKETNSETVTLSIHESKLSTTLCEHSKHPKHD